MVAENHRSEVSTELAVEAANLGFAYGSRKALDGLSFEVRAGEIFGFLGPNGGGKTTLFRLLATLLRPQQGSASIFADDLVAEAGAVRSKLGVAFQSPSLDPHLSVFENLIHQGHLYGLRGGELRRRIGAQLDNFGLTDRRRDRVQTLSGGLKRRVEIAKAMVHQPRLLLLDEPSTGLDPGARRDLWVTLQELQSNDNVTVLLTTHFIEEGDRCDRLALVDRGRIVAEGEPAALKREIGGDIVVVRTSEPGTLADELQQKFGLAANVEDDRIRFEKENAPEFVGRLAQSFPGRIEAIAVSKPTLEDVFLRRTGRRLGEAS